MTYAFETSSFSVLFKHFYRKRFPSLWNRFDILVDNAQIASTREVSREIKDSSLENLRKWLNDHQSLFTTPTAEEGAFVTRIYATPHFQQNIEQKKIWKGGKNADPFVIAKAAVSGYTVVTEESLKSNAAKIPNICKHFGIQCITLEQFMEKENWKF